MTTTPALPEVHRLTIDTTEVYALNHSGRWWCPGGGHYAFNDIRITDHGVVRLVVLPEVASVGQEGRPSSPGAWCADGQRVAPYDATSAATREAAHRTLAGLARLYAVADAIDAAGPPDAVYVARQRLSHALADTTGTANVRAAAATLLAVLGAQQ